MNRVTHRIAFEPPQGLIAVIGHLAGISKISLNVVYLWSILQYRCIVSYIETAFRTTGG